MYWKQTPSGGWKYYEKYKDPMTGKIKTKTVTLEKNTLAAQREARAILDERIAAACAESGNTTGLNLDQLRARYMEYQRQTVKPSTYTRNLWGTQTLCTILGGDTLANKLTANYIKQKLLDTDREPGTLNEYMSRLRAWMRWAYQNDYLESIAFLDKIPRFKDKPHSEKISDKFLEVEEVHKVIERMEQIGQTQYALLTRFLILTGLRIGEAIALTVDDISLANKVITVAKTYDVVNNLIQPPKTQASIRQVPISPDSAAVIRQIMQYNLDNRHSVMEIGAAGALFPHKGRRLHYYSYNKALKSAVAHCGIQKHITAHALRHTAASLMMENNLSIDTISRLLGHENSKITREIYLHTTEKLRQKDFDQYRQVKLL